MVSFFAEVKFSDFGQKPWTIIRRFYRNRGDYLLMCYEAEIASFCSQCNYIASSVYNYVTFVINLSFNSLPLLVFPQYSCWGMILSPPGAAEKYGLAVGDHATSENIVPCWECRHCKSGRYNLCLPHDVYGWRTRTQGLQTIATGS